MKIGIKVITENITKEIAENCIPNYLTNNESILVLKSTNIKKIFSGTRELPLKIFERTLEKGFFTLRPRERALVGTNLIITLPENFKLNIYSSNETILKKGISVICNLLDENTSEICIGITNITDFPIRVNLFEEIAYAQLTPIEIVTEWEIINGKTKKK